MYKRVEIAIYQRFYGVRNFFQPFDVVYMSLIGGSIDWVPSKLEQKHKLDRMKNLLQFQCQRST